MDAKPHHEDVLVELWLNLMPGGRRALCALAYVDATIGEKAQWNDLPIDCRMRLVRAMHTIGQIAIDCANALASARAAINARH